MSIWILNGVRIGLGYALLSGGTEPLCNAPLSYKWLHLVQNYTFKTNTPSRYQRIPMIGFICEQTSRNRLELRAWYEITSHLNLISTLGTLLIRYSIYNAFAPVSNLLACLINCHVFISSIRNSVIQLFITGNVKLILCCLKKLSVEALK